MFLNFAGGCVFNKEGEVLLQKEVTLTLGGFLVVQWKSENLPQKRRFEK